MRAFPLKLHANDNGIVHMANAEWEENIKALLGVFEERNATIKQTIAANDTRYKLQKINDREFLIGLEVRSHSPLLLESMQLKLSNGVSQVQLRRDGIEDVLLPVRKEKELITYEEKYRNIICLMLNAKRQYES